MPLRLRIHAVTVVPMFAPIITPTACPSCISPEFTKPTTITVVAADDWMTAVTATPSSSPFIVLFVSFDSMLLSWLPAAFSRDLPKTSIP